MLKEFATDDHAEVIDAAGGSAFQFFERTDQITKSASDVISKKDVSDHMPPDGHFGIHLITMGAEEDFGPNRNFDSASRESLTKYHPTFEKFGCVFREHKNKCQKTQGVGHVKLARYNPKMGRGELIVWVDKDKAPDMYKQAKAGKELSFSMSCFPAGTMVTLPDGSLKPIEDIRKGDEVLTHKGNVGVVEHTLARDYNGKLYTFQAWGLGDRLTTTEEHPLWARIASKETDPCPICGVKFKSLKAHMRQKMDAQHVRAYKDYERYTEGFWPAHYLSPKDTLRTAIPRKENTLGSDDLAKVIGYYLSEGSLSVVDKRYTNKAGVLKTYKCSRVEWTFGLHETAMAEDLADAVQALGHTRPGIFREPKYSRLKVASCSKALHDWLLEHCGKYSWGKKLSREVMEWAPRLQKIILAKWLDGDGHWCTTNLIFGGCTASRQMAMQLLIMSARCGLTGSLGACDKRTTPILGKEPKQPHRRTYTLRFHLRHDAEFMRGDMTKIPEELPAVLRSYTQSVGHLKHQKEGQLATITRATKPMVYAENGFLYRRIRKVSVATVATVTVYDLTVSGDHGFHADGVGVSNCRLPHDRCSCCNSKAKRVSDYCSHLKSSMGKYVPEFRKYAYARNEEDVKFFDISEVKRRADRIATFLGYSFSPDDMAKAASEDRVITGAQWAEFYGNMEPVAFAPWESETLRKMAAEVQFVKHADQHTLNTLVASLPRQLPHAGLEKLAKADFRSVGGELAKRAMILDFASFAAIITGETVEELRKKADFRDIEGLKLPELLEAMEANEGCMCGDEAATAVAPDEYGTAFSSEKDSIDNLMEDVAESLELKPKAVSDRALTITIKMASVPQTNQTKALDPVFNAMAEAYGHYLVKAAHIAKDVKGVSPMLLFRSIAAQQIFSTQKGCQQINDHVL